MGLPSRTAETRVMTIPSTKKEIKFKPFLQRHQEALMMSLYTEDADTMVSTIMDVMNDCIEGGIEIDKLAFFDVQFMLLKLRMASVGEEAPIILPCQHCEVDREAEDYNKADDNTVHIETLKLEEIDVHFPAELEEANKFVITSDGTEYVVELQYPTFAVMHEYNKAFESLIATARGTDTSNMTPEEKLQFEREQTKELGRAQIEIWHKVLHNILYRMYKKGDKEAPIHMFKDHTPEDIQSFIDEISVKDFNAIKKYMSNIPTINKTIEFKCGGCGAENKAIITGTEDFLE